MYKSFGLNDCLSSILCVEKCVSDVKTWMTSNKLQMNEDNMDVLLVTANKSLGSIVDVALASEAEGCGFDPPTGRQVPTTACGSPN